MDNVLKDETMYEDTVDEKTITQSGPGARFVLSSTETSEVYPFSHMSAILECILKKDDGATAFHMRGLEIVQHSRKRSIDAVFIDPTQMLLHYLSDIFLSSMHSLLRERRELKVSRGEKIPLKEDCEQANPVEIAQLRPYFRFVQGSAEACGLCPLANMSVIFENILKDDDDAATQLMRSLEMLHDGLKYSYYDLSNPTLRALHDLFEIFLPSMEILLLERRELTILKREITLAQDRSNSATQVETVDVQPKRINVPPMAQQLPEQNMQPVEREGGLSVDERKKRETNKIGEEQKRQRRAMDDCVAESVISEIMERLVTQISAEVVSGEEGEKRQSRAMDDFVKESVISKIMERLVTQVSAEVVSVEDEIPEEVVTVVQLKRRSTRERNTVEKPDPVKFTQVSPEVASEEEGEKKQMEVTQVSDDVPSLEDDTTQALATVVQLKRRSTRERKTTEKAAHAKSSKVVPRKREQKTGFELDHAPLCLKSNLRSGTVRKCRKQKKVVRFNSQPQFKFIDPLPGFKQGKVRMPVDDPEEEEEEKKVKKGRKNVGKDGETGQPPSPLLDPTAHPPSLRRSPIERSKNLTSETSSSQSGNENTRQPPSPLLHSNVDVERKTSIHESRNSMQKIVGKCQSYALFLRNEGFKVPPCPVCDGKVEFVSSAAADHHFRKYHSNKSFHFVCNSCNAKCKHYGAINRHLVKDCKNATVSIEVEDKKELN